MRFLPHTPDEIAAMLKAVGAESLESLFSTIPQDCRRHDDMDLPEPISEWELMDRMSEMANQVVLDMLMATISIDGITQAEADAYFQMAADMGMISEEAAEAAKTAYGDAIAYINGIDLDDKTIK